MTANRIHHQPSIDLLNDPVGTDIDDYYNNYNTLDSSSDEEQENLPPLRRDHRTYRREDYQAINIHGKGKAFCDQRRRQQHKVLRENNNEMTRSNTNAEDLVQLPTTQRKQKASNASKKQSGAHIDQPNGQN